MTLASFVRQRRDELGYSQRDLAKKAHVTHSYVSHIERGRIVNPTLKSLHSLARALDMTFEELLFGSGLAQLGDGSMVPRQDAMAGLDADGRRLVRQMIDQLRDRRRSA